MNEVCTGRQVLFCCLAQPFLHALVRTALLTMEVQHLPKGLMAKPELAY